MKRLLSVLLMAMPLFGVGDPQVQEHLRQKAVEYVGWDAKFRQSFRAIYVINQKYFFNNDIVDQVVLKQEIKCALNLDKDIARLELEREQSSDEKMQSFYAEILEGKEEILEGFLHKKLAEIDKIRNLSEDNKKCVAILLDLYTSTDEQLNDSGYVNAFAAEHALAYESCWS